MKKPTMFTRIQSNDAPISAKGTTSFQSCQLSESAAVVLDYFHNATVQGARD